MPPTSRSAIAVCTAGAACLIALSTSAIAADWTQFRGPGGRSLGSGQPPVVFGAETNLVWKVELPPGNSSPILWGDRILLTATTDAGLTTLCLRRSDGGELWRRSVKPAALEPTHRLSNPSTPTPVADTDRVYCYFGSYGVIAYDRDGNEVWKHPLPAPVVEFGTSASPVRVGDLLVLVRDQDSGSHLLALKVSDGTQVWRTERPEFRRSFATPLVWEHDGTRELVVPGSIWLKSYDPATGNENWTVSGTSRVATSSPAMGDGLLFTASWNVGGDPDDRISMEPFETTAQKYDQNKDGRFTTQELPEGPVRQRFSQMDLDKDGFVTGQEWETMRAMFAKAGNAVLAIRPGGKGEITSTHLAWKVTRSLPYVSSPLYYDGRVYTMKNGGLASCYEAKTGKPFYQDQRVGVGSDFYSSAIGVDGKIYITSQTGTVIVLKAGDTFEVLSRNTLGEEVFATPAIVDGNLVVRSARHLWSFQSRPDTR